MQSVKFISLKTLLIQQLKIHLNWQHYCFILGTKKRENIDSTSAILIILLQAKSLLRFISDNQEPQLIMQRPILAHVDFRRINATLSRRTLHVIKEA